MATTSTVLAKRGSHFLFFVLLAVHGLLLSSQVTTESGQSALRVALLALLTPVGRATGAVVGSLGSTWSRYIDLRGVREENRELRERISRLEQSLWMEREMVASYERLSQVLQLSERLPFPSVVAEVVGLDASAWFRTITINRGTTDGVRLNAPVIAAGGLVGRVTAVGPGVARVQLLSDRDCSVGALLVRGRARGIVSGAGKTALQMRYVSNLEDVAVGDLVVTSGIDGLYPKGLAIGRVASVTNGGHLFKLIALEAAADLERLEEVFVLEPVDRGQRLTETVE